MTARPDNTVPTPDRPRRHALPMAAAILMAGLFMVMHLKGYTLWAFSASQSLSALLAILAVMLALYHAAVLFLTGHFRRRPGRRNDLAMMTPVLRFVAILAALAATFHVAGIRPPPGRRWPASAASSWAGLSRLPSAGWPPGCSSAPSGPSASETESSYRHGIFGATLRTLA